MENLNQRLSYEEAIKEIHKIKDKDVLDFIFMQEYGKRKFLEVGYKMYLYFNNLLIISFMYLYGKYLHWRKTKMDDLPNKWFLKNSSNFMRIITTFDKLYSEFNFTYEFVENILNDIQILLNSENSAEIMREFEISGSFKYSPYFSEFIYQAKIGRYSNRLQLQDLGHLRYLLIQFLDMLPFVINIDIEPADLKLKLVVEDEEQIFEQLRVFDGNIATADIDMNYSFIRDNQMYRFYFLESVTQRLLRSSKKECLILNYFEIGNFNTGSRMYVLVKDKDATPLENKEISSIENEMHQPFVLEPEEGVNGFKNKLFSIRSKNFFSADHFIKDFNTINFRYIRILSLAISDILDDDAKKFIYDTYSVKSDYATMFVRNILEEDNYLDDNNLVESGYAWDVVIATLLIQESATKLLSALFNGRITYFQKLIKNLNYRFGSKFNLPSIEKKVNVAISEELANVKNKVYGNRLGLSFRRKVVNEESIRARIQALAIVKSLSELTYANQNTDIEVRYPLSIISRIKIVDEIKKSAISYEDGKHALLILVDQTLKTLYCFYHALFAYAKEKFEFEKESILNQLTTNQVEESQSKANKMFDEVMSSTSQEMQAIPKENIYELMMKFKDFCKRCAYPGQQDSYNELLKRMLGRDFLLTYQNIACFEDCFEKTIMTRKEFDELADMVKTSLEYLKTGKSFGSNFSEGIIFPYVAFLDYTSKTRDGYVVNHFSVFTDESVENDFKVISEYTYSPNQGYYCIPNRFRSNDELKLWIEPIMINCKHMDYDMQHSNDGDKK